MDKKDAACDITYQNSSLFDQPPEVLRYMNFLDDRGRENILTVHKVKLSEHRTRQKENLTVYLLMTNTKDRKRKQCPSLGVRGSKENKSAR